MPPPNQTVGTVQVVLAAVDDRFRAGFAASAKAVEGFTAKAQTALGAWLSFQSLKGLADFVDRSMDAVVALRKQSDQLGITTESMAGLRLAATQSGVEQEQLAATMTKLQTTIHGATVENADALASFNAIGVKLSDLNGKSFDQQFAAISDAVRGMGDESARTAAVVKLFGEQGRALLPMLMQGGAGLNAAREEAGKLGLALSAVDTGQVVEAKRALNEAGEVISGMGQRFAVELSPYITAAVGEFIELSKESGGFKDTIVRVVETAVRGAVWVYDGWLRLGEVWQGLRVGVTWFVKTVMDSFTYVAGLSENVGKIINAGWDLTASTAVAAWKFIKSSFIDFVDVCSTTFADFLGDLGGGLNVVKDGLGDGLLSVSAKIKTATGDAARAAAAEWSSAKNQVKADAKEFSSSVTGLFDVNLDEVGLGEAWQQWRHNIADNYQWELAELQKQDANRIAMVAKAEAAIAAIKTTAAQRAAEGAAKAEAERLAKELEAMARGLFGGGPAPLSAGDEEQRLKNRRSLLDSAAQDPRVKHELEVNGALRQIGQDRVDALARIEEDDRVRRLAEDPATDPAVAKQLAVDRLLQKAREDRAKLQEDSDRQAMQAQLGAYGDFFGNLKTLTDEAGQRNTAMFYINKAAAAAQAEINAWLTYSNVLAQKSILGPETAEIFAGTALAAGQVAVAQILAQQPPGRATGGQVRAGQLYEVGERGPELLQVGSRNYLLPGAGGSVTSNDALQRMAAGGARGSSSQPPPVNVVIHNYGGGQVETRDRTDADGARTVDVIVQQAAAAVAGQIRTGTGPVAASMRQTYPQLNRAAGATR